MSLERTSSLTRVTHGVPEASALYARHYNELFANPPQHPAEREKLPHEVELLAAINERMKPFVESRGGVFAPVTPDHYKILTDEDKMTQNEREDLRRGAKGHVFGLQQHITLFGPNLEAGNPFELAYVAVHEGLHFQSGLQAVINDKVEAVIDSVSGFSIYNPRLPEQHTGAFDEAETEDLTINFLELYSHELPYLQQFVAMRDKVRNAARPHIGEEADEIAYIMVTTDNDGNFIFANEFRNYAYRPERDRLADIRTKLVLNSGGLSTEADVSAKFSEGYFTGNMGGLKRTVDDTLGRGTFKDFFTWKFQTLDDVNQKAST